MKTVVGPRSPQQPSRTNAAGPVRASAPGFPAHALVSDLNTLLGSGQLAVSLEKTLSNEKKRLENLGKGPLASAVRLSPKAAEVVGHRIREIDLVLQAHVMQPSMERQLDHEQAMLQGFYARYCS